MESKTKCSGVNLKLVINKKEQRIVYGEADKNFIDFLFTILSLPVGAAMDLLCTQGTVGPLTNLHRSADALDVKYFDANQNKDNLLHPKLPTISSEVGKMLPFEYRALEPTTYYRCWAQKSESCRNYFASRCFADCPVCGCSMTKDLSYVYTRGETRPTEGGYVKGLVMYMVMDNLTVKPLSTASVLNVLNVEDAGQIVEKLVHLDMCEGVMLLKASFRSSTVLNDVFLRHIDFS